MSRFYHFTQQKHLLGIAVSGLQPQIYEEVPQLTMGQPVVWLTTQETLKPSKEDLAYIQKRNELSPGHYDGFEETLLPGRDMRLTVNLDPLVHRKKLAHYHTWMYETKIRMCDGGPDGPDELSKEFSGRDVLNSFEHVPASKHWWIYLGTIKPSRIELNPTAGRMLPSIEHNLKRAIEEGDAERVRHLTEMRDRVLTVSPDRMLALNVERAA